MGNLELDNQMKEQAVKFGDFERSYEGEIQHLEGEWNTAATTREGAERASPGTEGRWLKSGYDGWEWWENCSGAWGGQYEAEPERTNLGGKNPSHGDCRWISFISTLCMCFMTFLLYIFKPESTVAGSFWKRMISLHTPVPRVSLPFLSIPGEAFKCKAAHRLTFPRRLW